MRGVGGVVILDCVSCVRSSTVNGRLLNAIIVIPPPNLIETRPYKRCNYRALCQPDHRGGGETLSSCIWVALRDSLANAEGWFAKTSFLR